MEMVHWIGLGAVAALLALAWLLSAPLCRGWEPLNDRMADQSSRSAELVRECATAPGLRTGPGSLSTIR